jgi:hypothetical protein
VIRQFRLCSRFTNGRRILPNFPMLSMS